MDLLTIPLTGETMQQTVPCIGCGAQVPEMDGPTFRYPNSASPGCWHLYGEILNREYGIYHYPDFHRLTVDTYALQHPGAHTSKTTQSIIVHLAALHLIFTFKYTTRNATIFMDRLISVAHDQFLWLEPPTHDYNVTVVDVLKTDNLDDHREMVTHWAKTTYEKWSPHWDFIQSLIDQVLVRPSVK